jgi:formylglycine-generating enzyme required for sulfatase activity/serine/threonine protein kinase
MFAALSSFGSWAKKRKRLLAGVVGVTVKSASACVPGVSLAAEILGRLAEKAAEDILDPESKQPLAREQLAELNDWMATLSQKYSRLLDRLEQLPLANNSTLEQLTHAVESAIQGQDDLVREFDACIVEVRRQTLSLGFIERKLDEHFHVQKRMAASLEDIKAQFIRSPLLSEWAEFRRARPESVRAVYEADEHFLAGRKDQGIAVLLGLLRQRGVGEATLAHQLGLIELSRGDAAKARQHLRQASQAGHAPVVSATLASLSTMSGRSADVWRCLPRGFRLGRYRIEAEIGRGGMASVYRAESIAKFEEEPVVAIKVPAPALMSDPVTRQRFEQEIIISRRLSGGGRPDIVRVLAYDIFTDPFTRQEQYALIMELVEGVSLAQFLASRREANKPLKISEVERVMAGVCSALEYAHAQGVYHRDLKPHNVMVAKGLVVKLMDFGIARVLDDSAGSLTRSGQVVGTPAYLPPELQSGSGIVDARTDVYMAGILLLELLTGDASGDLESRPDCPSAWVELIDASTRRLRASRPANIATFWARFNEKPAQAGAAGSTPELAAGAPATKKLETAESGKSKTLIYDRLSDKDKVVVDDLENYLGDVKPEKATVQVVDTLRQSLRSLSTHQLQALAEKLSGIPIHGNPAREIAVSLDTTDKMARQLLRAVYGDKLTEIFGTVGPATYRDADGIVNLFERVQKTIDTGLAPQDIENDLHDAHQDDVMEVVRLVKESRKRGEEEGKSWATITKGDVLPAPIDSEIKPEHRGNDGRLKHEHRMHYRGGGQIGCEESIDWIYMQAAETARRRRREREAKEAEPTRFPETAIADGRFITIRPRGMPRMFVNAIGMKFMLVPAGTFVMGSPYGELKQYSDEAPQHTVEITKGFYMGVNPVTQEEYERVMGNNPSWFSPNGGGRKELPVPGLHTLEFPVECVSWLEAVEFARRLSALPTEAISGRTYRLPTEAEWEYACRGGAPAYQVFHFGDSLYSKQANFDGNHPYGCAEVGPNLGRTCEVGSYPSNGFGLYDMHGNVWEWCQDWYDHGYYAASPRRDPQGPQQGSLRVIRGGGWEDEGAGCRSAVRYGGEPEWRARFSGFRVVAMLSGDAS